MPAESEAKLDKVTGLAVVDEERTVLGVISQKDINRLKKQARAWSGCVGVGGAQRRRPACPGTHPPPDTHSHPVRQGVSMSEAVGAHMSTPPIVVRPHAKVGEAAALMLATKIHRLPVVDDGGKLVG